MPVNDREQLKREIREYQNSNKKDPGKERYLIQRAIELGCVDQIPDEWELHHHG